MSLTPHVIDTQKIPSMPFSGIQGIGKNFNGIQGIDSSGRGSQPVEASYCAERSNDIGDYRGRT